MQKIIIPTLIILAPSCGWELPDPCKPGILFDHLDPAEQAACQECGATECASGETGGEESLATTITCSDDLDMETHTEYCFRGQWSAEQLGENTGQIVVKTLGDCVTPSTNTYPCNRSWWDPNEVGDGPSECVSCNLFEGIMQEQGGDDAFMASLIGTLDPRSVTWGICSDSQHAWTGYGSGAHAEKSTKSSEEQVSEYLNLWGSPMHCQAWFDGPRADYAPFVCDVVQIRDQTIGSNEAGYNWTCRCETDEDCQPGAVCEAGWSMESGLPHPTLCTWDDGQGTSNGVAPEGPEVYGLATFDEGFSINGLSIGIDPDIAADLLDMGPVLNDDQRFDVIDVSESRVTIEITHCGPDALCSWLGWPDGTTITATEDEFSKIFDEDPATDGGEITVTTRAGATTYIVDIIE